MKIKLIDLKKQHDLVQKDILADIENMFDNSNFIMGDNVKQFEKEFSEYLGVKHCISVGNGTDALVISLKALGIGVGDEVITTPYTFFATAEAIAFVGAIPVFVDVLEDTFNIDPSKIEEVITPKTKVIMPVHIFGQTCDMKKINEIAKKHKLYVIEDACQSVGSKYDETMSGNLSDIACFSFFPTKNLGCAGDGGAIVTNNDDLATICKAYRVHGSGENGSMAYNIIHNKKEEIAVENTSDNTVYNAQKYFNYLIGHNSRLDEIQAIVLRNKLPLLDEMNQDRKKTAKFYDEHLNNHYEVPKFDGEENHVYHLYVLQTDNREKVISYLNDKNIATGIYYQVPLHLQKALEYLNYKEGDFPVAEKLSTTAFAIPMHPFMTDEEKQYVVNNLLEAINE